MSVKIGINGFGRIGKSSSIVCIRLPQWERS